MGAFAFAAVLILIGLLSFSFMFRPGRASHEASTPEVVEATATPAVSEGLDLPPEPNVLGADRPSQATTVEQAAPENDSRNTFVVVVKPKQTLRQISLRYLGWFDSNLVEEIRQLNPEITDPNQIGIGQRIRLPRILHGRLVAWRRWRDWQAGYQQHRRPGGQDGSVRALHAFAFPAVERPEKLGAQHRSASRDLLQGCTYQRRYRACDTVCAAKSGCRRGLGPGHERCRHQALRIEENL